MAAAELGQRAARARRVVGQHRECQQALPQVLDPDGRHLGFAKVTRNIDERRQMLVNAEDNARALASANSDLEAANAFLPGFIESYNSKFARPPARDRDLHRPLNGMNDLGDILCWRETRRASRTFSSGSDRATPSSPLGP